MAGNDINHEQLSVADNVKRFRWPPQADQNAEVKDIVLAKRNEPSYLTSESDFKEYIKSTNTPGDICISNGIRYVLDYVSYYRNKFEIRKTTPHELITPTQRRTSFPLRDGTFEVEVIPFVTPDRFSYGHTEKQRYWVAGPPSLAYPNEVRLDVVDCVTDEQKRLQERVGFHPSLAGWNRPKSHRYHLFAFPQEILDMIFSHLLIIQTPDRYVVPRVVTTNQENKYREPDYDMGVLSNIALEPSFEETVQKRFLQVRLQRGENVYIAKTTVSQRHLDATLLRTCKAIFNAGSPLLYGQNIYQFDAPIWYKTRINDPDPVSYIDSAVHTPYHRIPPTEINSTATRQLISQIQERDIVSNLPGWAFYDHFIRFLYVLQPRNAKLLRRLRFRGEFVHLKRYSRYLDLELLLMWCRIYLLFIREFCTGVKEIVFTLRPQVYYPIPNSREAGDLLGEILAPFCDDVARIEGLKSVVVDVYTEHDSDEKFSWQYKLAGEGGISWFRTKPRGLVE